MEPLTIKIEQTARLPLVAQAYLTTDGEVVVVELQIAPEAGLPMENLLFFRAQTFTVDQANQAILKIVEKPVKRVKKKRTQSMK